MSIGAIFSLILAIVKAIPILKKWLDGFFAFYLQKQIEAHDKDFANALKAILDGNQIPLEEAMGSSNAGKPAIRQDGVQERPRGGIPNEKTISSGGGDSGSTP